jgi:DUF3048 family protein
MDGVRSRRRAAVSRALAFIAAALFACTPVPPPASTGPNQTQQPGVSASPAAPARIVPARSVSVFGTSVAASGDFKGSGKSQIALLRDPSSDQNLRIDVREANADADSLSESQWLISSPGFFALTRAKFAVADVSFDGKDDLIALYDDGDIRARLLVFRSTGGSFLAPEEWWRSDEYAWARARNVLGASYPGIDRDGLLVTYQLDDFQMRIHYFQSTGSSFRFGGGQGIYDSGPGQFDATRARFAVGHFSRSSGPQQLAAFYQYPNFRVRLYLFEPTAGGLILGPSVYETAEGEYDLGRATISAADVTGDGKDDLLSLYVGGDGIAHVHVFDAASSFRPSKEWTGWASLPATSVCIGATGLVVGDWNGDRKIDADALAPADAAKVRSNLLRNLGTDFKLTSTAEEATCPRWPLTGLPLTGAMPTRRPLYVKIDNNPTARPHHGISRADQVYEWLVEGLTTRLAAVFHSQEPGVIGSVRSARMTDAPIVPSLRAAFVYSGGGPEELMQLNYDDVVAHRYIDLKPAYGWGYRVGFRPAPYNYFTTLQLLRDALSAAPGGNDPVKVPSWDFLPVSVTDPTAGGFGSGAPATAISVPYRAGFGVSYFYDPGSRTYARFNEGVREVDGANGEAVAVRNIVVIQTEVHFTDAFGLDPAGNPKLDMVLTGSGRGSVFRDGLRQEVTWTRPDIFDVFALANAAGEAVKLAPGQTWIQIVPSDWTIPSQ